MCFFYPENPKKFLKIPEFRENFEALPICDLSWVYSLWGLWGSMCYSTIVPLQWVELLARVHIYVDNYRVILAAVVLVLPWRGRLPLRDGGPGGHIVGLYFYMVGNCPQWGLCPGSPRVEYMHRFKGVISTPNDKCEALNPKTVHMPPSFPMIPRSLALRFNWLNSLACQLWFQKSFPPFA